MTSHFLPATDGASDLRHDEMCAFLIHVLHSRPFNSDVMENKVRALLEGDADVNYRNHQGRTPIMVAAGKGIVSMEQLLAKQGPGSVRIMQLLLDHGADLCAQDQQGKTALMVAICAGSHENVKFLLQFTDKHNFLNLTDCDGSSALSLAIMYGGSLDIVENIIRRGADVNMQNIRGDSPLLQSMWAFFFRDVQFLTTLLAAGSDVNQQNHGHSPLDARSLPLHHPRITL